MPGVPLPELLNPCRTCDRVHIASDTVGWDDRVDPLRRAVATLTPQEYAVFTRMAGGHPNQYLADALSVTESTIKAHLTIIRRKLAVATREHLVLAANIYNARRCAAEPSNDDLFASL